MIDRNELSKGMEVVYIPSHVKDRMYKTYEHEYGRISSWNDKYIFVRYNEGDTAAATDAKDLHIKSVYDAVRLLNK